HVAGAPGGAAADSYRMVARGLGHPRLRRAIGNQKAGGHWVGGWAHFEGVDRLSARPQETAAQFKMFAIYQAQQREYLGGMMRAIISKPPSDSAIEGLGSTGMK